MVWVATERVMHLSAKSIDHVVESLWSLLKLVCVEIAITLFLAITSTLQHEYRQCEKDTL